jgi:hypothetical protein
MKRVRQKEKMVHIPSTKQVLYCLSDEVSWCQALLQFGERPDYKEFLSWLLEKKFSYEEEERTSIKKIAESFGEKPVIVTKWIHLIYDELIELNYYNPSLFRNGGIPVTLFFSYFDSHSSLAVNLQAIPRQYERFSFSFIKAKLGTDRFYVESISHDYQNGSSRIMIYLEGGSENKYRDWLREKALFYRHIGFWENWHLKEFQIDDRLKELYPG